MTSEINRIFDSGECLTLEEMQSYIDERVSGKELNRMERHLLDCEMCNDAMDGLRNTPDAKLNLEHIDDDITELFAMKPEIIFPWQIAAAFALIFVSTLTLWLVIPKADENKLAEKTGTQEQQFINSDQSAATVPAPVASTPPQKQNQTQPQAIVYETQAPMATSYVSIGKNSTIREEEVTAKVVMADEASRDINAEKSAEGAVMSELQTVSPQSAAPAEMNKKATADKYKEEELKPKDEAAFSSIKNYESSQAVTIGKNDKNSSSLPPELYLNTAITQIESGDYFSAEKNLISYLQLESPKRDQAYWYLSKIYLHNNDDKKAKEMLTAVIKENKSFVKEAQVALTKLK